MNDFQSWGRFPKARHRVKPLFWRSDSLALAQLEGTVLAYGNGRSYGDVCLNPDGWLLAARGLNRFIAFDAETGVLRLEAGVTLEEVLQFCLPRKWFLPVTPGTKFITIGGAIANDVHGKNHHQAGTFGRFVRRFELLRSSGERLLCSAEQNPELFAATIGGLGLTGLITWAEIQLTPAANPDLCCETIKFHGLNEFLALSAQSDREYAYSVAWLDCLAKGKSLARGLFMRANHLEEAPAAKKGKKSRSLPVPWDLPGWALNALSIRAFNTLYFHRRRKTRHIGPQDFNSFFYPLDFLDNWNRLYGRAGFTQYQCVVPMKNAPMLEEMLKKISRSGLGSFLAVLKVFGQNASPGLMSFPQPGITFALDFPLKGQKTFALLAELNHLLRRADGRVYPAKDCCLSQQDFAAFYPQWTEFCKYLDPRFSSGFWRRVMGGEGR